MPPLSTTAQSISVVPSRRRVPLTGSHAGAGSGLSSASVADADHAPSQPPVAFPSWVASAGTVRTGGVLAATVRLKLTAVELVRAEKSFVPSGRSVLSKRNEYVYGPPGVLGATSVAWLRIEAVSGAGAGLGQPVEPCVSSAQLAGIGPTAPSDTSAAPPAGTVIDETARRMTCPGSTCDVPRHVNRKSIGTSRTAPGATSPRYRLGWAPAVRRSASPETVSARTIVAPARMAERARTTDRGAIRARMRTS